mgnify:CR=1 FL=1
MENTDWGKVMSKIDFSKLKKPDYNSMDLEKETIYAYLTMGSRTPQNDDERKLLKEIKQIKKDGYTVDIPTNGI